MVAKSTPPELLGGQEVFRVDELAIRSRGWGADGFVWKDVKSFIRHPCTTGVTVLRAGAAPLVLTNEHSVYRVTADGVTVTRADTVEIGDRRAGDHGHAGGAGGAEAPVDVIAVADAALPSAQVTVDLSGVNRHDIGVTAWQWQNFHREGKYGTRLPVALYR